jgi:xyloglucan-specific exo-beta-1,4-glucanase
MSRLTSSAPRMLRTAALLLVALMGLLFTGPGAVPRAALAASQSYAWRNVFTGAGGGFVPGIVFNQTRPGLAFARMDIGGAYRLNPGTNTWVQLLNGISPDDWNLSGVESIATDPVDPNRLYIAAGTYTNNFTPQNGAILRSTDQGNTFQRTMLPFKVGGNMPGRSMGERLAIDPNLNSTIYFGARSGNGLWRSTDFGVTWSKVASFTAQATYVEKAGDNYLGDTDGVVWETFDPTTGTAGHATQTIYVGIADKANSIFRSTDGGATWAAVPGQPTGFLPHHGVLANGQLHITYSNGAGPFDGTSGDVWKLTTATGVWTKISPVPSTDTANDFFGYGGLAVDAQHPSTIMVSALNSWWPDTIFWRSTNGGTTWTRIWDWASFPSRTLRYAQDISTAPWLNFGVPSASAVPPVPSPKLGWMVGSMANDPINTDHILYGTGATMYGSNDLTNWDRGTTFHISNASVGVEETSVQDLISPPAGAPLISGLGDIGGFRHDDITKVPATMFTQPIFTTTNSLDYAELTPNFMARVGNNSTSGAPNAGFTFDGGTSWFQANTQPSGASGGTIAAAANASRVVWAPSQAAVSFSTNNGSSWTASTGIAQGAQVRSDRVNPSKFYGLSGGTFTVSTNGGASFAASAATGLPTAAKFKAVPGREGDIWVAGDPGGMWHSTDGGATFTHLANVTMADNIGFGRAAPGQTYPALYTSAVIGGIHGLFRSDDAGATWVRINDDQHQFATTSQAITGDPRIYGRVYVGTNGLGIEAGDIAGAQTADYALSSSPASVSVAAGSSSTTAIAVAPSGGFSGSVTFSASGLPAGVTASFSPASSATGTTLTLTAASSAAATTVPIVVSGASGTLTRSTTINLTVTGVATPSFTLAAAPASLTVAAGGSGTSSLAVTPSGGFSGSVTFSAGGLPAGVTASFSPPSSATGTTLTLSAASTAAATTSAIVITGTSGTLSRSTTVNLTVTPVGNGGGGVTVTPVVNSNSAFFNDQSIKLGNTTSLSALSVTIVIQRTTGVSFNGQFNTVGSQITQTSTSTASTITATFTLGSGQTLGVGNNWQFDVQTNGSGTVHPTTGDTFTVTYTTGGASFTQSGHF